MSHVPVCKTAKKRGGSRVQIDRLLKELAALRVIAFIPSVSAAQISVVRLGIEPRNRARRSGVEWRRRDSNLLRDRARQLILQKKRIAQIAFVTFRPELVIV